MTAIIDISWLQLVLFSLILMVPAGINHRFRLAIGREAATAIVRMVLQLVLVGLYLKYLFAHNSALLNFLWLSAMTLIGASAILGKARLPKRPLFLPVSVGLLLGLLPLMIVLLGGLLKPDPGYSARYLIPLAGMLLGNSLSGNIVALQRLFNALEERKTEYEGALVLGARPAQAAFPFLQSALRQALAPTLATMATAGLVTLPGMMTGQILGGSDPMIAIKYQLVIMLAIFVMLAVSVSVTLVLTLRAALSREGRIRFSAF